MLHYNSNRAFCAERKVEQFDFGRLNEFLSRSSEYEIVFHELQAGTSRSQLVKRFGEQTVRYTEICVANITTNKNGGNNEYKSY